MRGPSRSVALAALLVVAACASSFSERAGVSLQAALVATNGARDATFDMAARRQEEIVAQLREDAAKVPPGPEHEATVEHLKSRAHGDVAAIRERRDQVAASLVRAYHAIGMASVLLPLADDSAEKQAQVVKHIEEAYRALEATY